MTQRGWMIDLDRCIGCHSCTVACKSEQNTAPTRSPLFFKSGNIESPAHLSYRQVVVTEGGTYPDVWRRFVTSSCNHCQEPACMKALPGQCDHEACFRRDRAHRSGQMYRLQVLHLGVSVRSPSVERPQQEG